MDDWEQIKSNFDELNRGYLIELKKILDKSLAGTEHTEEEE